MAAAPAEGVVLQDWDHRYEKIKDLNRGSFGFVVLARDRQTGEQVALKFIARGPEFINKYVEREIINHMKLRHPHIISLREVFLTTKHLVLAMEYAPGGDLFHYVRARGHLIEAEARWFFQQIVLALDYCHRMGVTSRDIKLENTLLDSSARPLAKLADFGFSKDAHHDSAPTSRVGTPAYLAPEVLTNPPGQVYDGHKADVWCCGVILYVMVTNKFPFRQPEDEGLRVGRRLNVMLQRIQHAEYSFPDGIPLSDGLRDLVGRILVHDPAQRPSLAQIFQHPWFMEGLSPAAPTFNDVAVQNSMACQPTPAVLDMVREIVREAAKPLLSSRAAAQQEGEGEQPAGGRHLCPHCQLAGAAGAGAPACMCAAASAGGSLEKLMTFAENSAFDEG